MRDALMSKVFDDFDHGVEEARRAGGEQAALEEAQRRLGPLRAAMLLNVFILPLHLFRRR